MLLTSRRRYTSLVPVTGVQTCALPMWARGQGKGAGVITPQDGGAHRYRQPQVNTASGTGSSRTCLTYLKVWKRKVGGGCQTHLGIILIITADSVHILDVYHSRGEGGGCLPLLSPETSPELLYWLNSEDWGCERGETPGLVTSESNCTCLLGAATETCISWNHRSSQGFM